MSLDPCKSLVLLLLKSDLLPERERKSIPVPSLDTQPGKSRNLSVKFASASMSYRRGSNADLSLAERSQILPLIEEEDDASEIAAIRAEKLRWDAQLMDMSKKVENGPEWTRLIEGYYQASKRELLKNSKEVKRSLQLGSKGRPLAWDLISLHRSMKLMPSAEPSSEKPDVPPERRFISIKQLLDVCPMTIRRCST